MNQIEKTKRIILITGSSSGIGLDAARTLHQRGWRVLATCRKVEDCDRLTAEGLESFPLDLADPVSIKTAMDEVTRRTGGRLDALYNNGAYAIPGAVEDLSRDAIRAIFETNVFGTHELTCAVITLMRAQGHGRIVNCSSVLGLVAMPWRGAYNATKFALEGLTDTLRLEMKDTGITVSTIEPGPIPTPFRANARRQFETWIDWRASPRADQYATKLIPRLNAADTTPGRFERPASAVTAVLIHAIEAPRPRPRYYVTPATHISGVMRRILPTRALDWLMTR